MLQTWHDVVMRTLLSVSAGSSDNRSVALAKTAVQEAGQRVTSERDWNSLVGVHRMLAVASYSAGTVAYDAATRTLTLTGGTWPTWSGLGMVLIANVPYSVQSRVSDAEVLLQASRAPGADISAGTGYQLVKDSYTLPEDFLTLIDFNRVNNWDPLWVSPEAYSRYAVTQEYVGQPRVFTVMQDQRLTDRLALWFYPAGVDAAVIDLRYKRRAMALQVFNETTGTVSVTSGGLSVTGVGTAFTQSMAGAVLRFGTATAVPDGRESNGTPFRGEGVVESVESATALTLRNPAEATFAAVKYRISSAIPTLDGMFAIALADCAKWLYTVSANMAGDIQGRALAQYRSSLQAAAREDQRYTGQFRQDNSGKWAALYDYPIKVYS